jgi:hypothetical protein
MNDGHSTGPEDITKPLIRALSSIETCRIVYPRALTSFVWLLQMTRLRSRRGCTSRARPARAEAAKERQTIPTFQTGKFREAARRPYGIFFQPQHRHEHISLICVPFCLSFLSPTFWPHLQVCICIACETAPQTPGSHPSLLHHENLDNRVDFSRHGSDRPYWCADSWRSGARGRASD